MTPEQIQTKRVAAAERYAAAVTELHDSMIDLAALDRIAGAPGFGAFPDVVSLRHPIACPNLSGHWPSDVVPRMTAITAEAR
jgi:hypothetical protein